MPDSEAKPPVIERLEGTEWQKSRSFCPAVITQGGRIAWLAGQTSSGFEVHRMVAVALRRGVVTPPGWLTPLYFGLGLVALAAQIYVYGHTLQVPRRRAWMHWPAAAVVLVLVCIVAASLVAYPLRYAFE